MKFIQSILAAMGVSAATLLLLLTVNQARAGMSDQVLAEDPQPTLVWKRVNDMPVGVFSAAGSKQGRRFVVTGGLDQAGQASMLVQVLDLDTLTWTTPLKLAEGISNHTQVTLPDGRILIAGGKSGTLLGKLFSVNHTWLLSADLTTVVAGPNLPRAAYRLTSHLLPDGTAVLIANDSAYVFDPVKNDWAMQIQLRENRVEHASTVLPDGRVVVAGGIGRKTIEIVNFETRISTQLATRFEEPRDDLAAVTLPDGRVAILGGQNSHSGNTIDDNVILDLSNPQKSVFVPMRAMGIKGGVADLSVVSLGRWVITAGGETQDNGSDTELTDARIMDGKTLELWSLPQMSMAHDDALAVADGHSVLVIGGYSVNMMKIGPIETKVPSAVVVVERLLLPAEKFD